MKNSKLILLIMAAFTLILAACGGNDAKNYEPEAINEETDTCEVCGMVVADNEHATQIITKDEKSLKFDDLGCLYEWKDENDEDDIGAEFVRDFNSSKWVQIKDATFVYHEDFETPMAYGVYSFADKADAEALIKDEGKGELLDADALAKHEWKMNMDNMEGHGEHGDDMDEHDDHAEHGDDMHEEENHDEHDKE